jgi:hypothetical protein
MRVDDNPWNGTDLDEFGWGLLFDTDGDFAAYEYSFIVSGKVRDEAIIFGENTSPGALGSPADDAETTINTTPLDYYFAPGASTDNVRISMADTAIDGTGDYFIDFSFARSLLAPVDGIPLRVIGGTTSSAQNLSQDIGGCDNSGGARCTIADGASDPV